MNLRYHSAMFFLLISTLIVFGYCQETYCLIQFEQKADYEVGNTPTSVAVADLNNDQYLDLSVTNLNTNSVSILLGNDDGTFQSAIHYNTGEAPEEVVAYDFNSDKYIDLAIANSFDDTISIHLGNGDGIFDHAIPYDIGEFPSSITVADLNGDNKNDLAVANGGGFLSPGDISILLGNGDGTFQDATSFAAGSSPTDICTSDFNGDNNTDLAVTDYTDNTVSILLGNGDGTFQSAFNYKVGQSPFGLTVDDFNNDQKEDIAVANSDTNNVSILLGKGDGTFHAAISYQAGKWPIAVEASDFDQDGNSDLAVANSGDNTVSILQGSGNGTFQLALNAPTGEYPYDLTASDLNGDGWDDLVVVNNNDIDPSDTQERYVVSVLLNNSSTCPLNLILKNNHDALAMLRNLRDKRMALNTQGKRYIDLYYRHALEVNILLIKTSDLMQQARSLLGQLLPLIYSTLQGKSPQVSKKMIGKIETLLKKIENQASPGLRSSLHELRNEIKDDGFFLGVFCSLSPS